MATITIKKRVNDAWEAAYPETTVGQIVASGKEDYKYLRGDGTWQSITASEIDSGTATDGYVLTSDGAGNAAWEAAGGGSDGNDYITGGSFNTSTGELTLTGTGSAGATVDLDGRYLESHPNTSTLSGIYGSVADGTKIDTITVDSNGHITAITTGSTGDILGVTAGTGLTGGGTSGTVTLDVEVPVPSNGITDQFLRWGVLGDPYWDTVNASDVGAATTSHTHGNINANGEIDTTAVTPAANDYIVIADSSASNGLRRGIIINSAVPDGTFLANNGTWQTPSGGGGSEPYYAAVDSSAYDYSNDLSSSVLPTGWTNGDGGDHNWSHTSGTDVPSNGTGPEGDERYSGFWFTETSSGSTSDLFSISFTLSSTSRGVIPVPRKLNFLYSAAGSTQGTFTVYADSDVIFESTGDVGNVWMKAHAVIPAGAQKLYFKVTGAASFTGDVCIRNINIDYFSALI